MSRYTLADLAVDGALFVALMALFFLAYACS